MKLIKIFFTIIFLFANIINIYGQSVAVVLSGGGAKGLYHIGILKALEENSIPIDYISGTSMGAIIAGMYASGHSVQDMEDLFNHKDVKYWLSGKIEDKYQYYYKKTETTPAMLSLDVDLVKILKRKKNTPIKVDSLKNRYELPFSKNKSDQIQRTYSMYSSVQLDLIMMKLFSAASSYSKNDFDSLFVPFRCVSVDIYEKKEYLWSKGDLGMAIRSSMAIPIVFKPVAVDSMLMYDGGLRNNFPWKETANEFNPDVIIGGKCVGGTFDLSSVVSQVEMLIMNQTNYDIPDEDGVIIERNVDVGMLDYEHADEIIEIGYRDAIKAMPEIKKRIERRVSFEELHLKRLKFNEALPVFELDKLNIEGPNKHQKGYIKGQLSVEVDSQKKSIGFEEFKKGYLELFSENVFDSDFPIAIYDDNTGLFDLDVKMYTKPSFKAMIGLNISSTSVNQAYVGLHYRSVRRVLHTHMLDAYIGSFYSSLKLGSRLDFYGKKNPYYIDIALVHNFYDYAKGNSQRIIHKPSDFGYSKYNDSYASTILGIPVGRSGKLEFRIAVGYDSYSYTRVPQLLDKLELERSKIPFATANVSLSRNSLNYLMFPTRGLKQKISTFVLSTNEKYRGVIINDIDVITGKYTNQSIGASFSREQYFNISSMFTIGYSVNSVYSTNTKQSNWYMDMIMSPSFEPTEHSKTLLLPEFRNRSFVAAGLKPIFELNESMYLKTEGYCYLPDITSYNNIADKMKYILSLSLVYQSPVGAISFNYSRYFKVTSLKSDYFTFNIGLTIFNKKGIIY